MFILLFSLTSFKCVESIQKRKLYNDLLTEDNELILIQQQNISPKKAPIPKANSTKNLANKNGSLSSTNKLSSHLTNVDNKYLSSKLIVNIVYASNKSETNSSMSDTISKRLVYQASSFLNPCDKNVCKSNETCVVVHSNNSIAYKCLLKLKRRASLSTTKNMTLITSHSAQTNYFTLGCNPQKVVKLKLELFAQFDELKRSNTDIKQFEVTRNNLFENHCIESVGFMLNLLDKNNDALINFEEWSKLTSSSQHVCHNDIFVKCDTNKDKSLSFQEFCDCFKGLQNTCKFIRDPLNLEAKFIYLEYLNEIFKEKSSKGLILTNDSYLPMCDINGNFFSHQCDTSVNCWCVNKNGEPLLHTLKEIHEDPFDCTSF